MATTPIEVRMSSPRGGAPLLTPDERAVLGLSATGLVTAQVAEALGVSAAVVRARAASAAEKLGGRSKLEAVLLAYRTGQLGAPARSSDG
jgi:DNA-binding CsgD family transcriptional regulator